MHVRPEVSTLDPSAGVQLSGFNIPGLATRRMETDVELSEGQSFVIAGLIDDRATENLARVPGLANIPILGTLFRSRQENKSRTELVVMVTPEIARPVAAGEGKAGPVMPKAFLPPLPAPREKPAGKRDQPSGKKP
jgi:pilus assembly protein CpaC